MGDKTLNHIFALTVLVCGAIVLTTMFVWPGQP
jgi:hypothetical protein